MHLRRKLAQFLASIKQEKPYYCEVEYLESSGTQYIDTGYNIVSSTDEVSCYFQLITTDRYSWLMGEHDNGARFGIGSGDGSNLRNIAYGASTYKVNDTEVYNSQHYFNSNSNGVYVNGTLVHAYENFTSTSTIYLFNLNLSGANAASGKIWRFTHKRNGKVIRDFIPVLDWDMTPCMYDRVTGQLFYNAGTGDFVAGKEVHYIEYLEGQGQQYIDTGIIGKTGILAKLKFKFGNNVVGGDKYVLGSASVSPSVRTYFGTYQSKWMYGCGNYKQAEGIANNTVYDCEVSWLKGNQYVIANGEKLIEWDQTTDFNTNFNLYLFGRNNAGSAGTFTSVSTIYYCQLFDNGILVRDYKPAIDENGVGYMFDRVSHTFFENKGTGAFKYSAVKADYIEVTSTPGLIDLELKYKPSMNIALKYMRTAQGDSGSVLPLTNTTTSPLIYFPALNANAKTDRFVWRRGGYNEQKYSLEFTAYPTPDYEVLLDADHDNLYIDGTLVLSGMINGMAGYASPYESYSNLMMFSINKTYGGLGKVYYVKIWDKYQIYRDLVPAWKDGEFGMYDRAHDVLYKDTGGGTVVLGKISESHYFD